MSTTKNKGIALAVGMFIILSVVAFGSILYVGFTAVNTEIVVVDAMEDMVTDEEGIRLGDYLKAQEELELEVNKSIPESEAIESIRRGDIEYVPTSFEPVAGSEVCPLCPPKSPVIRDPRVEEPVEPAFGSLGDNPIHPRGALEE